jgi:hypothetical protein
VGRRKQKKDEYDREDWKKEYSNRNKMVRKRLWEELEENKYKRLIK